MKQSKPTIKEIAKVANLSVPAISQALNNTGRISQKTRDHIMEVCARLGYRPNISARAIRTGRFNCLTFLLGSEEYSSSFPHELFNSLISEIARKNLSMNVAQLSSKELTDESFIPKFLGEWMSDGLLINYNSRIPDRMVELIKRFNVPSVWLNSKHEQNSLYPDDYGSGRMAVIKLLKMGHKKIAYADLSNDFNNGHYSARDRLNGYLSAMKDANLEPVLLTKKLKREERIDFLTKELSLKRPTAIISYGSISCIIYAILSEMGMKIPRDISIITFSAQKKENSFGISITSAFYSASDMGRDAVNMLIEKIEKPNEDIPSKVYKYKMEDGDTCATLKKD